MIRVVHPGSRILMLTFYPSRIQGSKGTGTRIRIRNTAFWHLQIDPDQAYHFDADPDADPDPVPFNLMLIRIYNTVHNCDNSEKP